LKSLRSVSISTPSKTKSPFSRDFSLLLITVPMG
jgi:hypothetical protein